MLSNTELKIADEDSDRANNNLEKAGFSRLWRFRFHGHVGRVTARTLFLTSSFAMVWFLETKTMKNFATAETSLSIITARVGPANPPYSKCPCGWREVSLSFVSQHVCHPPAREWEKCSNLGSSIGMDGGRLCEAMVFRVDWQAAKARQSLLVLLLVLLLATSDGPQTANTTTTTTTEQRNERQRSVH